MFTCFVSCCLAQQSSIDSIKQNCVTINIGQIQFKDKNLHPIVFSGLNIGASYIHTQIKGNISEFSAGLNFAIINTAYETFPSALSILLQANYKYLFSIITNDKVILYWTTYRLPIWL